MNKIDEWIFKKAEDYYREEINLVEQITGKKYKDAYDE